MLWTGERRHLSKAGLEELLANKSVKFLLRFSSAAGLSKLEVDYSGTGTKHTQLAGKNWVLAAGEWQYEADGPHGPRTTMDLNSGTYMAKVKGRPNSRDSADVILHVLVTFLTMSSGQTEARERIAMYPDDF